MISPFVNLNRYTYSKSKGLFGGVSIEGSVIVERQDANCIAYESNVSAQMLLSGVVPVPQWADELIRTIESYTGQRGARRWVREEQRDFSGEYAFGGMGSPGSVVKKKSTPKAEFPPKSWGTPKEGGSYFESWDDQPNELSNGASTSKNRNDGNLVDVSVPATSAPGSGPFGRMTSPFDTTNADIKISTDKMTSPFDTSVLKRTNSNGTRPKPVRTESDASMKMKARAAQLSSQLENNVSAFSSMNMFKISPLPSPAPITSPKRQDDDLHLTVYNSPPRTDPNLPYHLQEVHVDLDKTNVELPSPKATRIQPTLLRKSSRKNASDSEEDEVSKHKRAPSQRFKAALKEPLAPEGVGRAIVRFDFDAVEVSREGVHKSGD
jgi:SH3 domain-containing YSC84-like protein 1